MYEKTKRKLIWKRFAKSTCDSYMFQLNIVRDILYAAKTPI